MSDQYEERSSELKAALDYTSRTVGKGSQTRAFQEVMYGLDTMPGQGAGLPKNTDTQGLVFFTRPTMNLSYDNLALDRRLSPLMTNDPQTYPFMIRSLLDPYAARDRESPFVDANNVFMPILSNTLISMSGWPDVVGDTYTASEGAQKESWAMFDGSSHNREAWDANMTFRNIQGDPITLLMLTWIIYGTGVYQGDLLPYTRMLFENRIDYYTGIYRLVLSSDGRFVTKIARTIGFPYAISLGAAFNYQADQFLNGDNDTISVPFKCIGAEYQDPILVHEFNHVMNMTNPDMRANRCIKLSKAERPLFRRLAYPKINVETLELEWYVPEGLYDVIAQELMGGGEPPAPPNPRRGDGPIIRITPSDPNKAPDDLSGYI